MKLRNAGTESYTGMDGKDLVNVQADEVFECSDAFGEYLLSDDSPGKFEKVKAEKAGK